ncbi:unnamed protein product [marine sediment metagenome]|uniref:Uncharacterized protein n=1 Tax=marine sediment metagenome TaxID=412755 RepID=X0U6Q8_9ZZZZ
MSVKSDLVECLESQTKTIYYKFQRGGWFKNKKLKFIIKPILEGDLITKEVTKQALKEMSTGQSIDEASRVAAENFKKMFMDMGADSAFKLLIEKSVKYPKIVDKDKGREDEIPFSLLNADIKIFLINEIRKISPVFQGK